ncbi:MULTISPECIES: M14 family zinc carboxypeptidase [unclassified Crossiella]|uniref:M14 family zinc carboxypeptidase n=1 Tax=unclassified Crossiella TaxID=2620835 RepID=UPI001FFF5286|nr:MULTISPECIES: M14 family zinc carboxypeptidase [unclassified Crossiella]MCK2238027.1 hypothetical protein [Crossiella sp. S99.2]MCK2255310.1 hypothetical protein [Crossiella sp. S99.1]
MAKRLSVLRTALAATAVAAAALLPAPALAQGAAADAAQILHVTAPGDPAELGRKLAEAGLDVLGREGSAILVLGQDGVSGTLAGLGARTVRVQQVPAAATPRAAAAYPKPKRLAGKEYPTFYGGYRTVEGFHSFVADVAKHYPDLTKRVAYGQSWQRQQDPAKGNQLEALCITAEAWRGCELKPDSAKPRFLLMAQIHAREVTTSEQAWRFITRLLDGAYGEAEVAALLGGTEVWVVPQVNPDGIGVVQDGLTNAGTSANSSAWQRKNLNDSNSVTPCPGPWSNNHEGIDLNRNWDSRWGGVGTSGNACAQTYRGPKAASEPETHQLAGLFEKLFPDQRGPGETDAAPATTRGAMITLHTYGNLVLMPWGHDPKVKTPNDAGLRSMAFRMSGYNGYNTGQPGEVLYNVTGAADDWAYDKLGIAGFTFEIGPNSGECNGFHPAYSCQDKFWELNKDALLYAAKSARQPYVSTLGPTVSGLTVKRGLFSVEVSAKADDNAYGTVGVGRPAAQKVVGAEIYLDRAPWDGGHARPLKINGDGATVEVGGKAGAWGLERLAYVRAKDADGNWGPFTSAWVK